MAYEAAEEEDILTPAVDNITLIHDEPAKPAEESTDGDDRSRRNRRVAVRTYVS